MDFKFEFIITIVGIIIVSIFIGLMMHASFHSRCEKAGYEHAELEACVKRASKGGPVYKENIGNWNEY